MVVLEWAERRDPAHADPVWFGREHPAFVWPPPLALVDRWPPRWVPHSVRLADVQSTARTWHFPPHDGRGNMLDPDESQCYLITVGTDEVENLILIWNDGSRALHAPRVQRTRRACLARAARRLHASRLRGNRVASVQRTLLHAIRIAPEPAGLIMRGAPRASAEHERVRAHTELWRVRRGLSGGRRTMHGTARTRLAGVCGHWL